jgi:hypothetical protein
MKLKMNCIIVLFAAVFVTISCDKMDVVGTDSVRAFKTLLDVVPTARDDTNGGWSIAAPDGMARFIWSRNFSESPLHDVMLEFNAAPFINAGLDPDKLPDDIAYYGDAMGMGSMIMTGTKLGEDEGAFDTPLSAYEHIVKKYRKSIGYHGALGHYGVTIANGALFEFAKDMDTNDKDIVFVLNPEPFLLAGVNPNKIEGWLFTKVTVDDENGKPIEVDKILKPFNLK